MKDKTILVTLRGLDVFGGTEIQTLNLCKSLLKNGYKVIVMTYFKTEERVINEFNRLGVTFINLNLRPQISLLELLLIIRKKIIENKPDMIHVQYMNPGLIPIIAAKISGVNIIFATVHQPGSYYNFKSKLFVRIASLLTTKFISVSLNTELSWFGKSSLFDGINFYKSRHCTIYNCVEIPEIKNTNELNYAVETVFIGVVARLRWEKGHRFLFKSFAESLKSNINLKLLIIGKGPEENELKDLAKELNIDSNIEWLGEINYDEMGEYYQKMDFVIVPSVYEGFGLTAIEAMSYGKPVIGTRVDGLKEVLSHNIIDRYLIDYGNVVDLKEKILELSNSQELRIKIGKISKNVVADNYSFDKYHLLINKLYSYYAGQK